MELRQLLNIFPSFKRKVDCTLKEFSELQYVKNITGLSYSNDVLTITFINQGDEEQILTTNIVSNPPSAINVTQQESGFSQFTNGTTVGDLAYAENSEGTQWLPGTMGGTYYPSGFYIWDGTNWVSDRNAIANELQNILNVIATSNVEKNVTSVAVNYTILTTDRVVLVDTTSGDITITLPAMADLDSIGVSIKKVDTSVNKIIIETPNAETIDNLTNRDISSYLQSRSIITDNTNYWQI